MLENEMEKHEKKENEKKRIYKRKVKYPESFLYSFSLWIQSDFYLLMLFEFSRPVSRLLFIVSVSFYMKMNEQSTIFTLFWIKGCCERTSLPVPKREWSRGRWGIICDVYPDEFRKTMLVNWEKEGKAASVSIIFFSFSFFNFHFFPFFRLYHFHFNLYNCRVFFSHFLPFI